MKTINLNTEEKAMNAHKKTASIADTTKKNEQRSKSEE
jgi:hypothetical protein